MLEKILLFASPIVSAATIASVIAVNSWKKKKTPKINITWDDEDEGTGRAAPWVSDGYLRC